MGELTLLKEKRLRQIIIFKIYF